MADPREDLSWRPVTDADVEALTAMLDAATRLYVDRPTTPAETAERLGLPGCEPSVDTLLAEATGGEVRAFAQVFRAPPSDVRAFARVHPAARGQGIGSALASWCLGRAAQVAAELQQPVRYSTTAWAHDATAAGVLRAVGLRELRHFLRMVTALPAVAQTQRPDVELHDFRPGEDDDALWTAYQAAFAEHWGQEQPDATSFWWDVRDSPASSYDPSLWTVTRDGDQISGFVIARVRERQGREEGYVEAIGVRPAARSKRIGQALLAYTLWQFEARGLSSASLDVDADNVTDALRLYRSVGMTPEPAFTIWGRTL